MKTLATPTSDATAEHKPAAFFWVLSSFNRWHTALLACLLWLVISLSAQAAQPQLSPKDALPQRQGLVTDADLRHPLLSADERQALEKKLADFQARTGKQVELLLAQNQSMRGFSRLNDYGQRVAFAWRPEGKAYDGVLVLVDRTRLGQRETAGNGAQIHSGLGFPAREMLHEFADRIVEDTIEPYACRSGHVVGINVGLDHLFAVLEGKPWHAPDIAPLPLPRDTDGLRAAVPERWQGPVADQACVMDASQRSHFESTLRSYKKKKGSEVAVLTVPSTAPEPIEQYALRVAKTWKLGRKDMNDGVLLLVAKDDRQVRIEVGYGLEGALPDLLVHRITEESIAPHFREQAYAEGIEQGVNRILGLIDQEALPPPPMNSAQSWAVLFIAALMGLAPHFLGMMLLVIYAMVRREAVDVTEKIPVEDLRRWFWGIALASGLLASLSSWGGLHLFDWFNTPSVLAPSTGYLACVAAFALGGVVAVIWLEKGGSTETRPADLSHSDTHSGYSSSFSSDSFSSAGGGDFDGGGSSDSW